MRFALGSLTERMLQHSTVPLLLVRIQDDAPPRPPAFKRILVPLDGSPLAEGGLDVALEVADPKAELLLLSIQRRHSITIPLGVTAVTVPDDKGTQQLMDQAKEYLNRIADGIDRTSWSVQTIVRRGDPAQQILETARDHDVDLIVLVDVRSHRACPLAARQRRRPGRPSVATSRDPGQRSIVRDSRRRRFHRWRRHVGRAHHRPRGRIAWLGDPEDAASRAQRRSSR